MGTFQFHVIDSDDVESTYTVEYRVYEGRASRSYYEQDAPRTVEVLSVCDASGALVADEALYAHAEDLAPEYASEELF